MTASVAIAAVVYATVVAASPIVATLLLLGVAVDVVVKCVVQTAQTAFSRAA